jgi:iron-sulfur cluster insertion protein
MHVKITDSAEKQIGKLRSQHGKWVRLSIESGGCQGFSKVWGFDEHAVPTDVKLDCGLLIDEVSIGMLDNAVIDYRNDLGGSYFSIDIPYAASTCGCGTSFSI